MLGRMSDTILMVGTRKGLWVGRSDERRTDWSWSGPHFDMTEAFDVIGRDHEQARGHG